ncbi:proton-conducting transporter membrane subunit [Fundidesulfovibrio terrae]|uniref:proton-conducting transporter transmembrane domain-containing protein n=1 Tax=Fundidesulfovibrio terrae TaxID=2922866 RepID=UPI001FAF3DF5
MALTLILAAMCSMGASGVPGLLSPRTSPWGQRIAASLMALGAVLGLAGAYLGYAAPDDATLVLPWPPASRSFIGVDALSAFFLVPIFLGGGLGSLYGLGYWRQREHPRSGRKLPLFWGLLMLGMVLLVISRHAMAFLLGWEVMALAAFFLVSTEDHRAECRQAGWVYLIATHIGTLALFALFTLWHWATGSYGLLPAASDALSQSVKNCLFLLALFGFGLKAGMMPLHFWLPGAHANAPSHVSAILSGVVLKMGIYGLLRMLSLLPDPPVGWGGLILLLGVVSGLLGVVFALGQHDLKRLLAYHSVENIGIILMGLGLAMLGRSAGRPEWVALGLAGCLLHVWNHALFKSLLFLCAGSVLHGARTREIDRLGGLAKSMPWTAAMFCLGAVAICGLPPLNGFVSEFFVYVGLLRSVIANGGNGAGLVLAVPGLAMIGALAVACFVKVYGVVFLGSPRTRGAALAQESPFSMLAPIGVLAACCVLIGLAPMLASPALNAATASWTDGIRQAPMRIDELVPLGTVGGISIAIACVTAVVAVATAFRGRRAYKVITWDCGYARPTTRMQYSASSFAQMIVRVFRWVLRPRTHLPRLGGPFPRPSKMHSHVDDAVMDRLLVPVGHFFERLFHWVHWVQRGLTQHYVLYILTTLLVMLCALMPMEEFYARLFVR